MIGVAIRRWRTADLLRPLIGALVALALSACTTLLPRNPVAEADIADAAPRGVALGEGRFVREWGDTISEEDVREIVSNRAAILRRLHADDIAAGRPLRETALLLSGGGPDGAFGAGVLNGWTARGDRPKFSAVTGISTGAIIALFAFLGPEYDDTLRQIYTTYTSNQLLRRTIFAGLTGGSALTDASGYRALIEKYVDDAVVAKIADGAREGRVLLIGTTNIDAARPVIWNISGIALSGHPNARRLIHDVIQASSAIPAAFPPVIVPVVTRDGRIYDEMHVDGGATQQVMYFSPSVPMRRVDALLGAQIDREAYVVINNKLRKPYEPVRPRLLAIAGRAASSLLGGSGTGDLYRILAIAQRDDIDLNIMSIPPTFDKQATEAFDPVYMQALFDLGYEYGLAGDRWSAAPPDFASYP